MESDPACPAKQSLSANGKELAAVKLPVCSSGLFVLTVLLPY